MRKRVGLAKPSLQPIVPLVATFVSRAWGLWNIRALQPLFAQVRETRCD
jgi:hypothetical protein